MDAAPLIALLATVLALLGWRAVTRERRDYARFKRMRSTVARQRVYRRWLAESIAIVGGLSAIVAFGAGAFVSPVLADAQAVPWIAAARDWLGSGVGAVVAVALVALLAAALVLPVLLLRDASLDDVGAVGDIRALLPRSRGELPYGAGLALSAGVFEETLFRLALPALVFGITGDALVAFAASAVVFGLLHLYQGVAGVLVATALGVLFSALYVLTGSLLWPVVLHVALDARSLVLIPVVIGAAGRRPRPSHPVGREG